MIKKIVLTLFIIAAMAVPSHAYSKQKLPDRWWDNPKIAGLIELTEAEKYELQDKYVELKRKLFKLKASVDSEKFELDILLDKGAKDSQVMAQYKKAEDARHKLGAEVFQFVLDTRRIIGSDRFMELKSQAKKFKRSKGTRRRAQKRINDRGDPPDMDFEPQDMEPEEAP